MKPDINTTINKLISYAFDNLLLDPLDEVYTMGRLATVCGLAAPVRDENIDYGDATLSQLLDELNGVADRAAVIDVLMPMPRTVNVRFDDLFSRNPQKAFDFLYELYAHSDKLITTVPACNSDGFICYAGGKPAPALVALTSVDAAYSPTALGNHVACFNAEDILAEDALAREAAYVTAYGGVIASRIGEGTYYVADAMALTEATAAKVVNDGAVKTTLLNYPVPALAFNGIAKNAVLREVMRVLKRAGDAELKPVIAAAAKDGITFYIVFAGDVQANEYLTSADPLTACGVFATPDYSALLSVLEKGTALSTDLLAFKPIYDAIGGVKHGAKATTALGAFIVDKVKPALAAAALKTADEVVALTVTE